MLPLQVLKDFEKSTTEVDTLFNCLNPLFTFIEYGLLHHLIDEFGSDDLKMDMNTYASKMMTFLHSTTLKDLKDHWSGEYQILPHFSMMIIKFAKDPQHCSLDELVNIKRKVCCELKISEMMIVLSHFKPGLFIIVWHFHWMLVTNLMHSMSEVDESFFEREHILEVKVNNKVLYPKENHLVYQPNMRRDIGIRGGKKFGQRRPPLSKHIKDILKRCPDGQIFKVFGV